MNAQPRKAVVVGGGIVGLSTAWFLQERGLDVTVVERDGVAAGASWGNAGWLSPNLAIPLPDPSVLRYGLKALFDPSAALYVPLKFDLALWRFLVGFASHCTPRKWQQAMRGYLKINEEALEAYDELGHGGVNCPTMQAPIIAAFEHAGQAAGLRHEFDLIRKAGQRVDVQELSGADLHAAVPQISDRLKLALQIEGQRYIDPGAFTLSVAKAVESRGGRIRTGFTARNIRQGPTGLSVSAYGGDPEIGDVVILANGAWLGDLGHQVGVRKTVQAGRGYSLTVDVDQPVPSPIYFPATRIACTPYQGRLRIGGTMEFRSADAPMDSARLSALIDAARPLLKGVDWDSQRDAWTGPRPVTSDGLPLIGKSKIPGVYVAGGHGMWGITLGPATGRLLAQQILTGKCPPALEAFDPLRR